MKYTIVNITKEQRENKPSHYDPELSSIYGKAFHVYGIENKGGLIIGSFILYQYNKLWQKHIITPPFLTDIQLILNCDAQNPSQINSFYKDVLKVIADYLKTLPHQLIEIVLPPSITDVQPFKWTGFDADVRYTYLLDLSQTDDQLLGNMSSQRRKNIKDAIQAGLKIAYIEDTRLIEEKALTTLSTKGAKYNSEIVSAFAKSNLSHALGVYDEDKLIAMTVVLHLNNQAFYLFGWTDNEQGNTNAGALSLWGAIQLSKVHASTFNFAGSQIPSIERYFRGFGGRLTPMMSLTKKKLLQ